MLALLWCSVWLVNKNIIVLIERYGYLDAVSVTPDRKELDFFLITDTISRFHVRPFEITFNESKEEW